MNEPDHVLLRVEAEGLLRDGLSHRIYGGVVSGGARSVQDYEDLEHRQRGQEER